MVQVKCPKCGQPKDSQGYDSCMVKLIDELNAVGLRTVEHCCGHGKDRAGIAIALNALIFVTVTDKVVWLEWIKDPEPTGKVDDETT